MEIRQYFNIFRRWAWLIILVVILGVIAGYVLSKFQTPLYRSSTMIMITQAPDKEIPNYFYVDSQQLAQTFTQLLTTQPVIAAASQRLGYPVPQKQITVEQVPNSELIQVTVDNQDPQRAADIANTLVTVFLEQNAAIQASRFASSEESLQAQIQQVDSQIAALQKQLTQQNQDAYKQQIDEVSRTIANLQNEINTLQQEIVQLDYVVNPPASRLGRYYVGPTPTVDQQLQLVQKQDRLSELKNLLAMYQDIYVKLSYPTNNGTTTNANNNTDQIQATLAQYQQIYSNLLANYESIRLARMRSTPNVVQVEKGLPANKPVKPQPIVNMALGGILGLLLSGGFSFFSEYLDNTLRSPEEVSEILHLPVLGYIGDMDQAKLKDNKRSNLPYVLAQPRSPVTEAFRSLRANLEFASPETRLKTLLVTSSTISEGKTTIATNLAIVMSQLGRRVILIDADLRRPRVHRALGISNVMGLSDVLRNHATIQEVAQPWGNSNLIVITSGSLPPNPAEVLSSDAMIDVLNNLKSIADVVIIDSPPSLLADSSVLSARVDGVLLVIQSNKTQLNSAMAMIEQLKRVGARVVGVALNRINSRDTYYYYNDLKKYSSYAYDMEKTQPNNSKKL
jgi:capsular exopolysaccharide synthesis family protein